MGRLNIYDRLSGFVTYENVVVGVGNRKEEKNGGVMVCGLFQMKD